MDRKNMSTMEPAQTAESARRPIGVLSVGRQDDDAPVAIHPPPRLDHAARLIGTGINIGTGSFTGTKTARGGDSDRETRDRFAAEQRGGEHAHLVRDGAYRAPGRRRVGKAPIGATHEVLDRLYPAQ